MATTSSGEDALRPLFAKTPVPIDYPVTGRNGETLGSVRDWSISPVCGCFAMENLGINCCCANCCCGSFTWGASLHYAGVGSTYATLSSLAAGVDFGDGPGAQGAEAIAKANAVFSGQQKREELIQALGMYSGGDESLLLRCCCMGCLQCQEVNQVFLFYRDSLGYTDLQYGSCWTCRCTRFYSSIGPRGGVRAVPYPDRIERGESVGPNYPANDLPYGYYFEKGVPKPNAQPLVAPPPEVPPPRNALLPGYLQPSRRVK